MKKDNIVNKLLIILIVFLGFSSIAYSYLVQDLTLTGTAYIKATYEYTLDSWGSGNNMTYQIGNFKVYNNTNDIVTAWDVIFNVPQGTTVSSSWNCKYELDGTILTVRNDNNGTIGQGQYVTFGIEIRVSQNYVVDVKTSNLYTTQIVAPTEQIIMDAKTTVNLSQQGPWGGGNSYTSNFNIAVKNSTDSPVTYWEVHVLVNDPSFKINSIWNADYVFKDGNELIFTGLVHNVNISPGNEATFGLSCSHSMSNMVLTPDYTVFKGTS